MTFELIQRLGKKYVRQRGIRVLIERLAQDRQRLFETPRIHQNFRQIAEYLKTGGLPLQDVAIDFCGLRKIP
ncbi:MAG TPA: hypothetical protein VLV50_15035, partial [Stellaceae bacterium]|nr:hypothetical protein [Stellaceae bacterium]